MNSKTIPKADCKFKIFKQTKKTRID